MNRGMGDDEGVEGIKSKHLLVTNYKEIYFKIIIWHNTILSVIKREI